ncbi:MAG: hypothetical protein ACLUD0_08245 [Eubacterium ramulus]
MNWGVLIAVLIYEVVSIVGIGAFMAYKNKKSGGAGKRKLCICRWRPPGFSGRYHTCLTLLGSAHNWGTCQNAASMGVIAAWFGIACVIMMVVITQITGPWIRRTGAKTIGDFLNKVFGKVPGTMISCVNAALSIAMVCLEVETIAITLSFLTGWSYMISAIVGGILAYALCITGRYERGLLG